MLPGEMMLGYRDMEEGIMWEDVLDGSFGDVGRVLETYLIGIIDDIWTTGFLLRQYCRCRDQEHDRCEELYHLGSES